MNDDIPVEIQDFDFPEMTNNQVNIWRLRDELNATRKWLRENTVDSDTEEVEVLTDDLEAECDHTDSYPLNRHNLWRCRTCRKIYKREL